jgi:hypothetical protein
VDGLNFARRQMAEYQIACLDANENGIWNEKRRDYESVM